MLDRVGQRVGLRLDGLGLGAQPQLALQRGQEGGLGRALRAVGVDDTDRDLVGELAVLGRAQLGGRLRQRQALEQHVLHQRAHMQAGGLRAERIGQAAHFLALGVGLAAVGEGSQQGDAEQRTLFTGVHR